MRPRVVLREAPLSPWQRLGPSTGPGPVCRVGGTAVTGKPHQTRVPWLRGKTKDRAQDCKDLEFPKAERAGLAGSELTLSSCYLRTLPGRK